MWCLVIFKAVSLHLDKVPAGRIWLCSASCAVQIANAGCIIIAEQERCADAVLRVSCFP